jgi:hypothetical protein
MARIGIENPPKGQRRRGRPAKDTSPLSDADRIEIVTRLAMYDSVAEIHDSLTERGISITHQAVSRYNPAYSGVLHQKWIKLFNETRERFHAEMMDEPIAQRAYRLRQLHKQYLKAEAAGQIPLAVQILEQAAKETGGIFTNVTKVKGQLDVQAQVNVTSDEMRNMLGDRLKEAMMKVAKPAAPKALSDQSAKG